MEWKTRGELQDRQYFNECFCMIEADMEVGILCVEWGRARAPKYQRDAGNSTTQRLLGKGAHGVNQLALFC